jgi:ribonucleoside-diphosphate reductase alpha chain
VQDIKEIPRDIRKVFVTAFDVTPEQHLRHQAAFQQYTDNSVSKTVNLPSGAAVDDVRKIYLMAHRFRCKGITIYRYGSKDDQVLSFDGRQADEREGGNLISAESEYSGGCMSGTCPF